MTYLKKLLVFEKNLSITQKSSNYTLDQVKSPNNKFDINGENLLQSYDKIGEYLKTLKKSNPNATYDKDIKPFVEIQINKLQTQEINFNEKEKLLYDSYLKNLTFENAIEISKSYEDFIVTNFNDQNEVKNLLIVIADLKYISYAKKRRTFTQWENCLVGCIGYIYGDYNAVQWFIFAVNLGADVLENAAICGWDCL